MIFFHGHTLTVTRYYQNLANNEICISENHTFYTLKRFYALWELDFVFILSTDKLLTEQELAEFRSLSLSECSNIYALQGFL